MRVCREYRNISSDTADITVIIEGVWLKMGIQLDFLKRLSQSGCLDSALNDHYWSAIERLKSKLSAAVERLEQLKVRSSIASRLPLDAKAVYLKRSLHDVVKDLEDWQHRFDPSWYLSLSLRDRLLISTLREKHREERVL